MIVMMMIITIICNIFIALSNNEYCARDGHLSNVRLFFYPVYLVAYTDINIFLPRITILELKLCSKMFKSSLFRAFYEQLLVN
jgi:hypothetical protein